MTVYRGNDYHNKRSVEFTLSRQEMQANLVPRYNIIAALNIPLAHTTTANVSTFDSVCTRQTRLIIVVTARRLYNKRLSDDIIVFSAYLVVR